MLPRREMIREAMTMKRTAVLSLLLCLLLTGCVPLTSELHQFDEQYEMPMPQEAAPAPAVGDDIRPRTVFASLYFLLFGILARCINSTGFALTVLIIGVVLLAAAALLNMFLGKRRA